MSISPHTISGRYIDSDVQQGVRYVLEQQVGEGGMGAAYLARREAPEGASPVVVKVVRRAFGSTAISPELVAQKEAIALGRLNERVPPCPFVVRFVDTGSTTYFGLPPTPWIAIEYVHGGVEGTTLEDRVTYSIHKTGYAFDPLRATHALRCLASGISEIHSVGVIHRDLTPGNVLCCGFGETEIFKISDFGLARPEGLGHTFAGVGFGTVGYAAPEQALDAGVGIETDVFALACIAYYVLTGTHYFDASTPYEAYEQMRAKARKSVLECKVLSPELRERPEACRALDAALAWGTASSVEHRPQTAEALINAIVPWLHDRPAPPTSSRRLLRTMQSVSPPSDISGWRWIVKHRPHDELVIQSAAWDTDGRCFALTPRGPLFWNGDSWLGTKSILARIPRGMVFARRHEAGGFLLGGTGGTLAVFGSDGLREQVHTPDPSIELQDASGIFDDLIVTVGRRPGLPPALLAMSGRRWLKPLPLDGVQNVAAVLRLDDTRWLVCGRRVQGGAFAALYSPLDWELKFLQTPATRAFVSGASSVERGLALIVGSDGTALRTERDLTTVSIVPGGPDLSASALDVLDREWVASLGTLWTRDPRLAEAWRPAWSDRDWDAPFVSMIADSGRLMAMTANAGIVEGRLG
ncbi:MAG TPA: serine/threonine-protein kinase [Polyangiaceae bacterium]|nr:serine/threonine-protein kinase [Polyangiaceae bacterium]